MMRRKENDPAGEKGFFGRILEVEIAAVEGENIVCRVSHTRGRWGDSGGMRNFRKGFEDMTGQLLEGSGNAWLAEAAIQGRLKVDDRSPIGLMGRSWVCLGRASIPSGDNAILSWDIFARDPRWADGRMTYILKEREGAEKVSVFAGRGSLKMFDICPGSQCTIVGAAETWYSGGKRSQVLRLIEKGRAREFFLASLKRMKDLMQMKEGMRILLSKGVGRKSRALWRADLVGISPFDLIFNGGKQCLT